MLSLVHDITNTLMNSCHGDSTRPVEDLLAKIWTQMGKIMSKPYFLVRNYLLVPREEESLSFEYVLTIAFPFSSEWSCYTHGHMGRANWTYQVDLLHL